MIKKEREEPRTWVEWLSECYTANSNSGSVPKDWQPDPIVINRLLNTIKPKGKLGSVTLFPTWPGIEAEYPCKHAPAVEQKPLTPSTAKYLWLDGATIFCAFCGKKLKAIWEANE